MTSPPWCTGAEPCPPGSRARSKSATPTCVVPGCAVAHGLQNHHWDVDYATCKTTSLAGLARVCVWHHSLISYEKWELTGRPGAWEWRPPPGGCSFETGPPPLDTS